MLTIRLQRVGRKRDPSHRIVVQDSRRHAQSGRVVEILGSYNPQRKQSTVNAERVSYWLQHGSGLSDTVHNLMINKGVIQGRKKNALPRKTPQSRAGAETEQTAAAAGAAVSGSAEAAAKIPSREKEEAKEGTPSEETAGVDSSAQESSDTPTETEAAEDQDPVVDGTEEKEEEKESVVETGEEASASA